MYYEVLKKFLDFYFKDIDFRIKKREEFNSNIFDLTEKLRSKLYKKYKKDIIELDKIGAIRDKIFKASCVAYDIYVNFLIYDCSSLDLEFFNKNYN